ncbi:MAG: hypothetical protein IT314_07410 [Anaerolineales bacterium]|nr:hypothetical protein [Anaerolineales bacterium]
MKRRDYSPCQRAWQGNLEQPREGDGKRVKSILNGAVTTYFVGGHYEVANGAVTKYYYAGSQRIAMRQNGALSFLLGDHLGSTSLVTIIISSRLQIEISNT